MNREKSKARSPRIEQIVAKRKPWQTPRLTCAIETASASKNIFPTEFEITSGPS
jgi:hypothetical protein